MSMPLAPAALAAWLLGFSAVVHGMTYVPIEDAALADRAQSIVVAEIRAREPHPQSPDLSLYQLDVARVIKGPLLPGSLSVAVLGSPDPDRPGALWVPGAPRFMPGEQVLLFLKRRPDGLHTISQLALGAFHLRQARSGEWLAVRSLEGVHAVGSKRSEAQESRRDFQRFSDWLSLRVLGLLPEADYWTTSEVDPEVSAKFTVAAPLPVRWIEFDEGRDVTLHAGVAGALGLPGGGYAELQRAIRAWNEAPGSRVRYVYGGTTTANGGLERQDGVNAILFDGLLGEILGIFDCLTGGVLAYAGFRSGPSRIVDGLEFRPIIEADVIVQNGVSCLWERHRSANLAELLTHELGHTLGLGHACGDEHSPACSSDPALDDAVMRAAVRGDGRGARLGADDIAGVASLYPVASEPGAPSSPGGGSGGGSSGVRLLTGLAVIALVAGFRRRWRHQAPLVTRTT